MQWLKSAAPAFGDPYLQWAVDTAWAGYHVGAEPAARIPLLIELTPQAAQRSLDGLQLVASGLAEVPGLYRSAAGSKAGRRYVSAFVRRDRLHDLLALPDEVSRFELSLPVGAGAADQHETPAGDGGPLVIGVIDRGCAFLNGAFRKAWAGPGSQRTRILAVWDQTRRPSGPYWQAPAGAGYGRELVAADINRLIERQLAGEAETRLYEELQHPLDDHGRVAERVHGTHVLDVAGGLVPPRALGASAKPQQADRAQTCNLIFVNLPAPTAADATGAATNAALLDGLHYILNRAGPAAKVVVNLSVGGQGGPHDGTSLVDLALEELMQQRQGLFITVAAGNAADERWSDTGRVLPKLPPQKSPQQPPQLGWRLQPNDTTDSFLELWFQQAPKGSKRAPRAPAIDLVPPTPLPALRGLLAGESALLLDRRGQPVCRLSHLQASALGDGPMALLAVAPNSGRRGNAPAGTWQLTLHAKSTSAVAFDAWIQRDAPPYTSRESVQSFFDHLGDRDLGRGNPLNNLACGPSVLAVGACVLSDLSESAYSSRPGAHSPSERATKDSQVLAPADESVGVQGLFAAGVQTGTVYRMAGTSIAAPRVARHLACELLGGGAPAAAKPGARAPSSGRYLQEWLALGLGTTLPWPAPRGKRNKLVVR